MNTNKQIDLTSLTAWLKHEDSSYARLSKVFKSFYWVLVIVYLFLIAIHFFTGPSLADIIKSISYCLAMLSFAFIFEKLYKDFKNIDYSLTTLELLKKAKKRYAPFGGVNFLILIPIVLFDIGLCADLTEMSIAIFQLLYFGAISFVILLGLLIWKIKYKPLYDNVCRLIKEFNR